MKTIIYKVFSKLHLGPIVYSPLRKIYNKKIYKQFDNSDISNAWNILYKFNKDVKSSSLSRNEIDINYDLQIIIPVYNVEKYIVSCIESVIRQKTNFTYIVTIINDGSTDKSRDLLIQFEGIKNIEIIDQPNKGLSGARNRGLKVIKGKYVTFLDSDDLLYDGAITSMMKAAIKHDADIVQGGYNIISEKGEIIKHFYGSDITTKDNDSFLKGYPWGKLFKASLLYNIRFPEGYWFEDTICSYLLFPLAKTKIGIKNIVYGYRHNSKGITITSKGKPKILDTLYITNSLLKDASQFDYSKSDMFYTKQFQQIVINQLRISTIKNKNIQKAVFIIHCHLIEKYFTSQRLVGDNYKYKEIENAIKTRNYKLYESSIFLL